VVVRDLDGNPIGETVLNGEVWDTPLRADLVHHAVLWQRARQRQGTHKTKGRGEVRKTTRKPWNQKGSGRARAGDLKAPHHVGGGNAHPIRNRDYSFKTNRRERRLALRVALSARAAEGALCVVGDLLEAPDERGRTAWATQRLRTLNGKPKRPYPTTLVVTPGEDHPAFVKWAMATRNLPDVECVTWHGVNVLSLLRKRKVVIDLASLEMLQRGILFPLASTPGSFTTRPEDLPRFDPQLPPKYLTPNGQRQLRKERKQQQQWKDRRAAKKAKRFANREVAREARYQRNLKYLRLPGDPPVVLPEKEEEEMQKTA